jgi:hypothetical protein
VVLTAASSNTIAFNQKAQKEDSTMKIKEIIIKDYEEIIAELREVFAQVNTWCLLGEDYMMY